MSLDSCFRLSGYLTLGLSCGALVFAETPFLPDLQICLPPVLALLLLAWRVEGRWRLPNWGANILGLVIAAGGVAWLAAQLTDEDSLLTRIPLHLALLPYMGPLLMAALLVKLFGARQAGDFWHLQGLGLMQIGLGCVLDGGPVFGSLLFVYFAAALACLVLRYRTDVAGGLAPSSLRREQLSARWLAAFTLRWTLLIAVPALLLFLLTPRRDNGAWEPLKGLRSNAFHAGGGSDEINLNDIGRVELNDEVALQVAAVDGDGQPKLDLPLDQRWRGTVLDLYEDGKWKGMHSMPLGSPFGGQRELPHFGSRQFFLTFTVPPRQPRSLVLAEPIHFGSQSARLPVVMLSGGGSPPLFHELAGSVLPLPVNSRRELRYRQVVPADDDLSQPFSEGELHRAYLSGLGQQLPPSLYDSVRDWNPLRDWTVDLLRRLAGQSRYRLPNGVRAALAERTHSFVLKEADHEAVARVLTDYLATSGEFTYSLDLTRQDRSIDPVLDFLLDVKQGHCERFATALALLLRSVGIPARLVKGFRGCESVGDGFYVVRQRHAHAWVEMLRPARSSSGTSASRDGNAFYEWVELDPTPSESIPSVPRFSLTYLWGEIQQIIRQGWQTLIVDYNAEEQANLWDMLRSGRRFSTLVKLGLAVPLLVAVFATGLFLRRLRLPTRGTNGVHLSDPTTFYQRLRQFLGLGTGTTSLKGTGAALYQRLWQLLGRYASLRPSFGQTPREYGEAAQTILQSQPGLAVLAEVPIRVIDLFYRERFGGQPLSAEESQALDTELDRFAEALRTEPRP